MNFVTEIQLKVVENILPTQKMNADSEHKLLSTLIIIMLSILLKKKNKKNKAMNVAADLLI